MKEVIREKIIEIVNANIENGAVTAEQYDNDLSELGMDSICFIQIIVTLEGDYSCLIGRTYEVKRITMESS